MMNKPFIHSALIACVLAVPATAWADATPRAGSHDSRVTFANYTEGQVYNINTRVRNVTLIELGAGEQIQSIAIGDLESFQVDKLEGSNVFTVKPVIEGASTNLTVETSGRFYFMHVREGGGTPNWSVKFSVHGEGRSARSRPVVNPLPEPPARKMRYAISDGNGASFAPIGISDDGQKTYFQIPAGSPMPAIFRADEKGLEYAVNSSTTGSVITVQGRSERWVLRYGDQYICVTGQ